MANTHSSDMTPGWRTEVLEVDTRDPADAIQSNINDRLARIQTDAGNAGFKVENVSVSITGTPPGQAGHDGLYAIIVYRLEIR